MHNQAQRAPGTQHTLKRELTVDATSSMSAESARASTLACMTQNVSKSKFAQAMSAYAGYGRASHLDHGPVINVPEQAVDQEDLHLAKMAEQPLPQPVYGRALAGKVYTQSCTVGHKLSSQSTPSVAKEKGALTTLPGKLHQRANAFHSCSLQVSVHLDSFNNARHEAKHQ